MSDLLCNRCASIVSVKPKGMINYPQGHEKNTSDNVDFLYDFSCIKCGFVSMSQLVLAAANFEDGAVNKKEYKSITSYINKMLSCDISCIDCPFRTVCYKDKFFYDINKHLLRKEKTKKDKTK